MKKLRNHLFIAILIFLSSCDKSEEIIQSRVETLGVEEKTDYSALCRGRIIERGSGTIDDYGIELNDGNGFVKHSRTLSTGNEFGVKLTGLEPNKTYTYKAYVNDGVINYGVEKQFTTGVPQQENVKVDHITITDNSAILYFALSGRYKEWGVHYSEREATPNDTMRKETQSNLIIDGLKPNTKYYILPFRIDENSKREYLQQISFSTTDGTANNESNIHNIHPIEQIRYVKYNVVKRKEPYHSAYRILITEANKVQDQEESALADFYIPRYYGTPEEQQIHTKNMEILRSDSYAAYISALAYRLSGDEKYADKAIYFLNAWARKNKSYSGANDAAQAMTRVGTGLVIAAELMSNTEVWSNNDRVHFINWVTNVYEKAGDAHLTRYNNNVRDWARFGSILSASIKGNRTKVNQITNMIKSDLFENIASDGHMPKEVTRGNNGLWYTYFSLAPMTAASWISFNMTGENIFIMESTQEASIKKALDYLLHYNAKPNEWPWEGNVYAGSPASWPGNLYEAMYGIYQDQDYQSYARAGRPIIYNGDFTWSFTSLMPVSLTGYN